MCSVHGHGDDTEAARNLFGQLTQLLGLQGNTATVNAVLYYGHTYA